MGQPDLSMVHVDFALTDVSIAYRNEQLVANLLFPPVPVTKQSNKYFVYSKDRFRVVDDARRPGAKANEIEWTLSTDTYYCEGHALAQPVPDELRANADPALDVDVDATETLTDLILLQLEVAAASAVYNPAVITQNTTLSGTSQWSDFTNSDPIDAIATAKAVIAQQIGREPRSLLISYPVYQQLRQHPKIIDRFKYTQVGIITPDMLKSVFDVDDLIIGSAIKNTAKEGQADALDYVWGKNALLFYRPPAMGRRVVTLGTQFRWTFGANTDGFLVKRYREESRTADVIETQLFYDLKIIAPAAGYLWLNAVA
jgi:hypothetical protein